MRPLARLLAVLFLLAAPVASAADSAPRPNILFFLADDQRHDSLGCAGHPVLQTPSVDRLARDGVRFTHCRVTTSICAASRASLFTGTTERTHGYTFREPPIPAPLVESSYPAVLREAGYHVGFVGKLGVSAAGGGPKTMFDVHRPLGRNPYFKPQPDGSRRHVTDITGDTAVAFVRDAPADQPFCLSVSFNAPHAEDSDKQDHYPWPPSEDGLYDNVTVPAPRLVDNFHDQPDFLQRSMNRIRWYWRWDTPEKYQRNVRAYFRMLTGVDRNIGRVLEALEATGRDRETIIIYSADNGYYLGDRGFAGKWSHYEQSLRVPLIVYDPRQEAAGEKRTSEALAVNLDVPATILDYAGVELPSAYQGRSLVDLVADPEATFEREDFFCEHLMRHPDIPKWEGVHDGRYVYARYFEQSPAEEFLHDLQADPDQRENFIEDSQYAEVLDRMRARCEEQKSRYEAARPSAE